MRNLSVRKKLYVGFGIVIFMILVILVVTVSTSLTQERFLNQADQMNVLQGEANSLQKNFLWGRIELRTVYTEASEGSVTSYGIAMDNINKSLDNLGRIDGMVKALPKDAQAKYSTINTDMGDKFNTLVPIINQINANNVSMIQSSITVNEAFDEMTETLISLYAIASNNLNNFIIEDADKARAYQKNVVDGIYQLTNEVAELRHLVDDVVSNRNLATVPEMLEGAQGIVENIAKIKSYMVLPDGKAAADSVLKSIGTCQEEVTIMIGLLRESNQLIADARTLTAELDAYVDDGIVAISKDAGDLFDEVDAASLYSMIIQSLMAFGAAILGIFVAVKIGKTITFPLIRMKNALVQVGETGKMSFTEEELKVIAEDSSYQDEVGQSAKAFGILLERLGLISENLSAVASGDLTKNVEPLSPDDVMGNSLSTMNSQLNKMFYEIQDVSEHVSSASVELAHSSQTLAQGSSEQAATVEEISASLQEINQHMNLSNNTAGEAAVQSDEISKVAQEGNEQMQQMMKATQEINEASIGIEKVIKVIDDIAFQTNILALNAAVEAARAGQHGKGFAVVADEVRNLAAKSAEAAKETSILISANIEKANLGMEISQQTAGSLAKIIDGTHLSSENIKRLATQSQQALASTTQVSSAVEQVTHVVQQNSATSEESAAASEEMSAQAQALKDLISRFKLSGQKREAAPSLSAPSSFESFPMDASYPALEKY